MPKSYFLHKGQSQGHNVIDHGVISKDNISEVCMPNMKSLSLTVQNIRIYHDFVQGQGNPPQCQRFAVHDEACRVVDVANL